MQKLDKWAMVGEKRQTCWPKLHIETEFESQQSTCKVAFLLIKPFVVVVVFFLPFLLPSPL